jgi:hypothetical protein
MWFIVTLAIGRCLLADSFEAVRLTFCAHPNLCCCKRCGCERKKNSDESGKGFHCLISLVYGLRRVFILIGKGG